MFRAFLYDNSAATLSPLDEDALFAYELRSDTESRNPLGKTKTFVWIDVYEPEDELLDRLATRFRLDPMILEDLRSFEGRPKLHNYGQYIYLIFHSLSFMHTEDERLEIDMLEVDCLLGSDWLLTIHPRPVPSFERLMSRWQTRAEWMRGGPPNVLYELMDSVLDEYFPMLDQLDKSIDNIEKRLFAPLQGEESDKPVSGDIFTIKRILLEMRQIAGPTRDVANILLRRDSEAGGKHFAAFQDLYDHAARIVENIDTFREILAGALDSYLAIESNQMNAIMKRLTSYSIILLLPTLIAGIYGMNFDDLPKQHGFYGSLGAMMMIVIALIFYFKRRGWL